MKHLIIAFLFLLFAAVQWNDSDSYVWISVYLAPAVTALLAFKGRYYRYPTFILLIVLILWMASYVPHITQWIEDGMPNIAGSMKAESPYIELTREFFGLFICLVAIWYYYILAKKNTQP